MEKIKIPRFITSLTTKLEFRAGFSVPGFSSHFVVRDFMNP